MGDAPAEPWLADRRLARLLAYWQHKRPAPDRLPRRADIDPLELGRELLPYVALIEVADGGARFRFRLVGTRLSADAGLDLTGRFIDEVNPSRDYADYIGGLYRLTLRERRPTYSETRYLAESGRTGYTRRLLCPLAADGQTVDMFVGAQVMETDEERFVDPLTMTFAARFEPLCAIVIEG